MANVFAIHSVGGSLVSYLRNTYPDDLRAAHPCTFRLLSSGEVATETTDDMSTTLSLLLYRVAVNDQLRTIGRFGDPFDSDVPLPLDLHYLMTVWAADALTEQTILGWAMRQLQRKPVLDTSLLSAEAGWTVDETIQVLPVDLNTSDILRLWEALKPGYRLSVAYVARVVRIGGEPVTEDLPVVATRYEYRDKVGAG